jgi:hypothetical protein
MALDTRLPLLAAQGASVNLADLYQQVQGVRQNEQALGMRQQQMDMQRQQMEQAQQQRELEQQREQAGQIAQLTRGVADEATYQQRLQAARAYGIDVSGAPPQFDPDWVQTQNILAETFFREGPDKLTNTAQELQEAGFRPGTPEFQRAMAQRIAMQDSKVVNTTAGGMSGVLGPSGYHPFILPNPGTAEAGAAVGAGEERKSIGGRSFVKRGGQWFEETAASNGAGGFQP